MTIFSFFHNNIRIYYNRKVSFLSIINLFSISLLFAQNPSSLEGLQVWLRADTNIVLDGNSVTEWISNDPSNRSFSQSGMDFKPLWRDSISALNNNPVISFDGLNDVLTCNSNMNIGSSYVVLNYDGGPVFTNFYGAITGTEFIATQIIFIGESGTSNIYNTGFFSNNIEINHTATIDASDLIDFKLLYGFNNTAMNFPALQIGKERVVENRYWNGSFAEIIVFDHSLSLDEKAIMDDYLEARYSPKLNLPDTIYVPYGFCDTTIYANPNLSSYAWSNQSNNSFTTVDREGFVFLTAIDQLGFTLRDSVFIQYPLQYPEKTIVCATSDIPVIWNTGLSSEDYQFNWSTTETEPTIFINQANSYWVEISDTLGCVYQSDTILTSLDNFALIDLFPDQLDFCSGEVLSFDIDQDSVASILWSTNDTLPEIIVETDGFYSVIIININECVVKDTVEIDIIGIAPEANFVYNNFCTNQEIIFTDNSIIQPDDEIVSYNWDFGDNDTGEGAIINHTYDTAGIYVINYSLSSLVGCIGIYIDSIIIYPTQITDFTIPPICSETDIYFEDLTITPDSGTTISWQWDLDNGSFSSGLPIAITSYDFSGIYNVQLITENSFGCIDTAIKIVTVDPTPHPQFNYSGKCLGNETIFTNTTDETLTGDLNYYWSFGDGTSPSTLQNPVHIYLIPNTYFIILNASSVIEGGLGCQSDTVIEINIYDQPIALFSNTNLCDSSLVTFSDSSLLSFGDTIVDYLWNVNGQEFYDQSEISYTTENINSINLFYKVTTQAGCSDSIAPVLTVNPTPIVDFSFSPEIGLPPLEVNFENNSIGGSIYSWSFGNNEFSDAFEPIYTYLDSGIYTVELIVVSEFGCTNFANKVIKIVKPFVDIAVAIAIYSNEGNFIKPSFLISNNGNNLIETFYIDASIDGNDPIREKFTGNLTENSIVLYEFSSYLYVEDPLNEFYFCAEISWPNGINNEVNYTNNKLCKSVNTSKFSLLGLFPNPVESILIINYSIPRSSEIKIIISDAIGQVVKEVTNTKPDKGFNKLEVEMSNFARGMYHLRIVYDNEMFSFPLLKE